MSTWQANREAAKASSPEAYAENYALVYDERYEYLVSNLEADHYLFEPALQGVLDSLVKRLVQTNDFLSNIPIRLLVGRYASPNAFSLGDGTIVINIGLLRRLQNLEQLTFVIAHEIAHVHLTHLEKRLTTRFAILNDKEHEREMKRLVRREETEAVLGMLQASLYDRRRHSRDNEVEADALALRMLQAAGLPAESGLSCLGILDTIDQAKYEQIPNIAQLLATVDYPIKERWLVQPQLMFGGQMTNEEESYWDQDSLRTHPHCQERITLLKAAQEESVGLPSPLTYSFTENRWERWADYEMIIGLLHFKDYGSALYHGLHLRKVIEDDPLVHCLIGRALNGIYAATLAHEFDASVPKPRSRPEEDWRELMAMIRKMRSREILNLSKHYLQKQQARFPDYKPLQEELNVSIAHLNAQD